MYYGSLGTYSIGWAGRIRTQQRRTPLVENNQQKYFAKSNFIIFLHSQPIKVIPRKEAPQMPSSEQKEKTDTSWCSFMAKMGRK